MAHQAVRDFLKQFMPDISYEDPNMQAIPHSLLYDFKGEFSQVRFTCNQLKDCLAGYLALIEPVVDYMQTKQVLGSACTEIYELGHDHASELLLAYFGRTSRNEDYTDLIIYIKESRAAEKVEQFYNTLEPDGHYTGDGTKRIYSIWHTLKKLTVAD